MESNRIVLNDYFPQNVQEDVLKEQPLLMHQEHIQKAIDDHVKPGMVVVMYGNFNLDKHTGYRPDIYGQDNIPIGTTKLVKHGSQPCISIASNDNTWDFTGCKFVVHRLFNDGLHIREYKGNNTFVNIGSWYTKRILDIDPNCTAATDRGILTRTPANRWIAPVDRNTGFAFKGGVTKTSSQFPVAKVMGFNTTTAPYELSKFRSNSVDTSRLESTGVNDGYEGNFPQDNGTTANTWGTWGGGWIGNWNAAVLITQNPDLPEDVRTSARLNITGGYIRGWVYAGVEVGSIPHKPDMVVDTMSPDALKYSVRNCTLKNLTIEDIYEAGIQRTRFDNLVIDNCTIRRAGHPDWSLQHGKLETPEVSQVDPGYGISSGRANQQGKLVISNCHITECNRKGIDAHHGTNTVIENNFIKAGYWGIQLVFEENQVNLNDPNWDHEICSYVIRDNVIHSGYKGIDCANGGFGPLVRTAVNQWYMRLSVKVESNTVYAPVGWYYNYAHDGFIIQNNTFTYSLPYGMFKAGDRHEERTFAMYHGSEIITNRGIPVADVIRGNRVMNSKYGNFKYGFYLKPTALCTFEQNVVDVTPWKKKTAVDNGNEPFISPKDFVCNDNTETVPFFIDNRQSNLLQRDNYSFNRRDLSTSIKTFNATYSAETLTDVMKNIIVTERVVHATEKTSADKDIFYVNAANVTTLGTLPPKGYRGPTNTEEPLVIYSRLTQTPSAANRSPSTTGVIAGVTFPTRAASQPAVTTATVKFKFTLNGLPSGSTNPALAATAHIGSLVGLSTDTGVASLPLHIRASANAANKGKIVLYLQPSQNAGHKVYLDGVHIAGGTIPALTETVIEYDHEYEVRILVTHPNLKNATKLLLGSHNLNAGMPADADFKEVAVYFNKDVTTGQLPE
nr:MAG TPA: Right handed beta helix region [Caudoviricetes sp.]